MLNWDGNECEKKPNSFTANRIRGDCLHTEFPIFICGETTNASSTNRSTNNGNEYTLGSRSSTGTEKIRTVTLSLSHLFLYLFACTSCCCSRCRCCAYKFPAARPNGAAKRMRWMQKYRSRSSTKKSALLCYTLRYYLRVSTVRVPLFILIMLLLRFNFFFSHSASHWASLTASYLTTTSLFLLRLLRCDFIYVSFYQFCTCFGSGSGTLASPKISLRQYEFEYFSVAGRSLSLISLDYERQSVCVTKEIWLARWISITGRKMQGTGVECAMHRCVRYTMANSRQIITISFTSSAKLLRCGALDSVNWWRAKQKRRNWENSIDYGMMMMAWLCLWRDNVIRVRNIYHKMSRWEANQWVSARVREIHTILALEHTHTLCAVCAQRSDDESTQYTKKLLLCDCDAMKIWWLQRFHS